MQKMKIEIDELQADVVVRALTDWMMHAAGIMRLKAGTPQEIRMLEARMNAAINLIVEIHRRRKDAGGQQEDADHDP